MITFFKIYEKDKYYNRDVIDAVIFNDEKLLDKLIEQGANLDVLSNIQKQNQTSQQKTALMYLSGYEHFMIRNDYAKLHNRMAKKLIDAGADVNVIAPNNFTALMYASLQKNHYILNLLIKNGAYWNVYNHQGKSFLELVDLLSNIKTNHKAKIIEKYPELYKEYLKQKELDNITNKYNL